MIEADVYVYFVSPWLTIDSIACSIRVNANDTLINFFTFQVFLLRHDRRCYFHPKCWQARTYKTFALPENHLVWDFSNIIKTRLSVRIIIAHIFDVYESIGEAGERETRRKKSIAVWAIRARRLTNDRVITSLNHASASTGVRSEGERDARKGDAWRRWRRLVRIYGARTLSCQLTNWKVRLDSRWRPFVAITVARWYHKCETSAKKRHVRAGSF